MEKMKMESLIEERGARGGLQPRFLRLEIGEEDDGKTIRDYLMKKIGFSARQISRFKYRMCSGAKSSFPAAPYAF